MAKRGDWLKTDPLKAKAMGRKGGKASGAVRRIGANSDDYKRGYQAGWRASERWFTQRMETRRSARVRKATAA